MAYFNYFILEQLFDALNISKEPSWKKGFSRNVGGAINNEVLNKGDETSTKKGSKKI